ncbi:DUF5412 family protein [Priestia megaterium]|uniref:DUF5412 family protein n=1 Tax=Priestia megaterium TaxID=1404 RepID=UPI001BEC6EE4|nr:DUF5412 family protein [Priestia megaterium]MBT2255492.1 hypothetical protein [Priestia megaterium]MBT2280171.1 hypothetical protein [Priestia megaterium]
MTYIYYKRKNIYRNYPQETAMVKWINDEPGEISDHTLNVKQDTFNANNRSN